MKQSWQDTSNKVSLEWLRPGSSAKFQLVYSKYLKGRVGRGLQKLVPVWEGQINRSTFCTAYGRLADFINLKHNKIVRGLASNSGGIKRSQKEYLNRYRFYCYNSRRAAMPNSPLHCYGLHPSVLLLSTELIAGSLVPHYLEWIYFSWYWFESALHHPINADISLQCELLTYVFWKPFFILLDHRQE